MKTLLGSSDVMIFKPFRSSIFLIISFAISTSLYANQIKVIDQFNKPIAGVVVQTDLPDDVLPTSIAVMDQVKKQFLPEVLIINKGQQVSFPNSDNIRHHVYSFSIAKPFEIRLYKETPSSPIMFDKAGVVALGCNIHDGMLGYIYVSDANKTYVTNELGIAKIAPNVKKITLWHPKQLGNISDVMHYSVDSTLTESLVSMNLRKAPVNNNKFKSKSRFQ